MKFDKDFWNRVNQKIQTEKFAYPERVGKLLVQIRDYTMAHADKYAEASDGLLVIAIDGRAASGKSTLAEQLREVLCADVIHMDDFFLPPALRTSERLAEPGGNVHYERFMEEVLPYLTSPKPFEYRIFDCSRMDYHGERVISNSQIRIVEGSYSCHPQFGRYADLVVYSDVEPEEQLRRIQVRNGDAKAKMFREKWIPMEERYFESFKIAQNADVCV